MSILRSVIFLTLGFNTCGIYLANASKNEWINLGPEMREKLSELKKQSLSTNEQNTQDLISLYQKNQLDKQAKSMVSFALGMNFWDQNRGLALQYFTQTEKLISPQSKISQTIRLYRLKALLESHSHEYGLQYADTILKNKLTPSIRKSVIETKLKIIHASKPPKYFLDGYTKYSRTYSYHKLDDDLTSKAIATAQQHDPEKHILMLEISTWKFPMASHSIDSAEKLVEMALQDVSQYNFNFRMIKHIHRNKIFSKKISGSIDQLLSSKIYYKNRGPRHLSNYEKAQALGRLKEYEKAMKIASSEKKENKKLGAIRSWHNVTGRILNANKQYEQSSKLYENFLKVYDSNDSRIREKLALSLSWLGNYDEALTQFNLIAKRNRTNRLKWHQFWNAYKSKNYEQAHKVISRNKERIFTDRSNRLAYLYWQGKVYEKRGLIDEAKQNYNKILSKDENHYYAHLVKKYWPELVKKEYDLIENIYQFASQLNKESINVSANGKLKILKAKSLVKANDDQYTSSLPLNDEVKDIVTHNKTKQKWKANFPLPWDELVSNAAEQSDIDKFLLLSIMRAESYYNPKAKSAVGAAGLIQMMPYTALNVSKLIGDTEFKISDIYNPELNISYGAIYLKYLGSIYNRNLVMTVASYNAGPEAVNSWIQRCQDCSIDEFVEAIPYRETRSYVKKVIRYYSIYREKYLDQEQLMLEYPLLKIEPKMAIF